MPAPVSAPVAGAVPESTVVGADGTVGSEVAGVFVVRVGELLEVEERSLVVDFEVELFEDDVEEELVESSSSTTLKLTVSVALPLPVLAATVTFAV